MQNVSQASHSCSNCSELSFHVAASPNSGVGHFIAIVCIAMGVIFLAMPLAIVGDNFTVTYRQKELVS